MMLLGRSCRSEERKRGNKRKRKDDISMGRCGVWLLSGITTLEGDRPIRMEDGLGTSDFAGQIH